MTNELTKIGLNIVEQSNQTIISSIDQDGYPNVKAMLPPRDHIGLKTFFFTTNTSSLRIQQFRDNQKSSLYFYNALSYQGIMLLGEMQVITDQAVKDRIWHVGDDIYYQKGKTDPDYCVLQFTAHSARLYQNFSSVNFTI
jgi:general stress protein 26